MAVHSGSGLRRLGRIQTSGDESCFDLEQALPQLLRFLEADRSCGWRLRTVGVNNAAWLLECDHREGWMIKRISTKRLGSNIPTGVENCDHLVQKFPEILKDSSLAFPHSVVEIWFAGKKHLSDLLVSRRCSGVQLGRLIAELNLSKSEDQQRLEEVCAGVGELLADFHTRYIDGDGHVMYHTDFHPSNVLYDLKTDRLTIIDLDGMGAGGITDDAEKFEWLMSRMAGERYSQAFRQRYLQMAPEEVLSASKAERSSSKSTAASSAELLYPAASLAAATTASREKFQSRSTLAVPESGFDPTQTLVTLAWLVSPGEQLTQPRCHQVRRRKAWLLYQHGRKDGYYLQHVPEDVYGGGLMPIEKKCEEFINEFPEILEDPHMAFPHCVIPLQSKLRSSGQVFVAKCACTTTLEKHVTDWRQEQKDEEQLKQLFRQLGIQLSESLGKYTTPNTPQLRPSCVLYEAATGHITFADFAWPGDAKNAVSSVDRLCKSLKLFADNGLVEEFCEGYAQTQRSRQRHAWSHVCWQFAEGSPRSESSDDGSETELLREDTELRSGCTAM